MRIPLPIKPFLLGELRERGPGSGCAPEPSVQEPAPSLGPWIGQHNLYQALRDLERDGMIVRLEEPLSETNPERLKARGGRAAFSYRLTPIGSAFLDFSTRALYRWSEQWWRNEAILGALFVLGMTVRLNPLELWHLALAAGIYLLLRFVLAGVTTLVLRRRF